MMLFAIVFTSIDSTYATFENSLQGRIRNIRSTGFGRNEHIIGAERSERRVTEVKKCEKCRGIFTE